MTKEQGLIRERPNPKHKSQNTKDTSPRPSLSLLLSLSCTIQVCECVQMREGASLFILKFPTEILPKWADLPWYNS